MRYSKTIEYQYSMEYIHYELSTTVFCLRKCATVFDKFHFIACHPIIRVFCDTVVEQDLMLQEKCLCGSCFRTN